MVHSLPRRLLLALICVACGVQAGNAGVLDTWRDDAGLRAIDRVGGALAWAVGDHGAVFRTTDGGQNWRACPIPDDVSLHAVCFLTGQVGWVAGGGTTPFTTHETGVVYHTRDGGDTWERVNQTPLPRIAALRFFSAEEGLAAGAATPLCPSGVLRTSDGGKTWTPHDLGAVPFVPDWRDAAFSSPTRGLVVGYRGRHAVVGDGQLLPSRGNEPGYRGLNAVVSTGSLQGWAAGDGGMVLSTDDGGLVWKSAAATLPAEARELFDFHTIAAAGDHVWVAGNPGTVVWHSNDRGKSWQAQPTGMALPIHDISFQNESDGIAVGAIGSILRTIDGGATWRAVRGTNCRAAMMVITGRPGEISFPLLATLSADQGYRSVTILPARHDLSVGGTADAGLARRTHDAVVTAGGNAALTDWPLPVAIPGIEENQKALMSDWNRRTEGRLEEVIVGRLVVAVRTWRPDVVVLDIDEGETACGDLIRYAAEVAIDRAGDATRLVGRNSGLSAWSVKKLYVRTNGREADASVDATELLTRLGESVGNLSDRAAARLGGQIESASSMTGYQLIPVNNGPTAKPFFAGVPLAPGSEARRAVEAPREDPRALKLANRQRMLRGLTNQILDDPRQAAGLLAQVEEMSSGLDPDQAARQLLRLGDAQRERHRWDLAEEMYVTLVRRYPGEPASREAAKWLLRLWTGAEPVWRRMREMGTITRETAPSVASLPGRINRALEMAEQGIPAITPGEIQEAGLNPDPPLVSSRRGTLDLGGGRSWENQTVADWRRQAVELLEIIHENDPVLFASHEVRSTMALLTRTGDAEIQRRLRKIGGEENAIVLIQGQRTNIEEQVEEGPQPCRTATEPPHLDAEFSDPCWQGAAELTLRADTAGVLPEGGLAMMTHDDRFLYIALSIPRVPGREIPPVEMGGRTHDADMGAHDRVMIRLDRDRDRVTAYEFTINERGHTAERCWEDTSWNPQWYVAAAGDTMRWRIECAIPLEALGPIPPRAGEQWGVTIGRVVPAIGAQGWPGVTVVSDPAINPGQIRFE